MINLKCFIIYGSGGRMRGNIEVIKENMNGSLTYGFIFADNCSYFFHKSDLKNCTIYQLSEGDTVEFETAAGNNGKDKAINVRKMYQSSAEEKEVNPGINPLVRYEHLNEDEQKILHFLGKTFYVTSGGAEFKIRDSVYKYSLIKPTSFFTTTFQLTREIVVIFSDYVSFEPRSLDAAAHAYSMIKTKLTSDRGCHIFICHDDDVETKLRNLLKDSNLNQIVIPFTYRELLAPKANRNLIIDRFKKYLFDTDLFAVSAPIQNDIFFFGRRDVAQDIHSKCKNNTHCGVFGLRRSGKTSLLYAVRNLLKQQEYHSVFIPCESELGNLEWRMALCKVVQDVYQTLKLPLDLIDISKYQSANTTIYFEQDLNYALSHLSSPIILMFDEIEAITFSVLQGEKSDNLWLDGNNFLNFWNNIKGYYSKYPKHITVLVAGTNPMINEVPVIGKENVSNPMYRQLSDSNQGAYLKAFTVEDTKNMVNTLGGYMGLEFDEYSIGRLTSDCGGHPYLIRILCSFIHKYVRSMNMSRPAKITKSIYDKALPKFEKSSEAMGFFWMILNILMTSYPREFNTLKILALEGDKVISQIQDNDALLHLLGYGIIENNQGNYAIRYTTITHFLRGEYRFERQGLNVEEQKQEIQLRINNAEMQLRKLVKNTLQMQYGTSKAKQLVITAMTNNTAISERDVIKANEYTYPQLFDASINKMYFSLLRGIILENLNGFSNIFENCQEEVIKHHLLVINKARRCPDHSFTESSENWSWGNFAEFRESISWLESILKEFE